MEESDQILDNFLAGPAPTPDATPDATQQPGAVIDAFTGSAAAVATGMPQTATMIAQAAEDAKAQKLQAAEEAEQEKLRAEEEEAQRGTLAGLASAVGDSAGRLSDKVSSFPTPGGIGLLLLVIITFVWMLVPTASGYTRMQLLYLTLRDQTTLSGEFSGGSSGGGGGSFAAPVVVQGSGGAVPLGTPVVVTPIEPLTGAIDFSVVDAQNFL